MSSPFRFLRAGPPPPRVALLSDALFFTRSVPVAKGATPAQAAAELELALEGISPFPLAQLYYGWFWVPGAERALVFASYRRRFTAEQTADWEQAELVLPTFAAVLGAEVDAAKAGYVQSRSQARANDAELMGILVDRRFTGRTMAYDAKLDADLAALTAEQVNAALRKYLDPARMIVVRAGDWNKAATP